VFLIKCSRSLENPPFLQPPSDLSPNVLHFQTIVELSSQSSQLLLRVLELIFSRPASDLVGQHNI